MPPEASAPALPDRFRAPAALVLLLANGVLLFGSLLFAVVPAEGSPGFAFRLYNGTSSFLSVAPVALPVVALMLVTVVRPALWGSVPLVAAAATAELGLAASFGVICLLGGLASGVAWQSRLIGLLEALAWLAVFAVALLWTGRTWLAHRALAAAGPPAGQQGWVTGEVVQQAAPQPAEQPSAPSAGWAAAEPAGSPLWAAPPTTYSTSTTSEPPRSGPPPAQETRSFNTADFLPDLTERPAAAEHPETAILSGPGAGHAVRPGFADVEPELDPDEAVTKAFRAPDTSAPPRIPDSAD